MPTVQEGHQKLEEPSSAEYPIGHEGIDAQHAHVFQLMGALAETPSDPAADTDVIIEHLLRFVRWHFATEEAVMQASAYPGLELHRAAHRACLEVLAKYRDEFERNGRSAVAELNAFLSTWMNEHTLRADQEYMSYVATRPSNPT